MNAKLRNMNQKQMRNMLNQAMWLEYRIEEKHLEHCSASSFKRNLLPLAENTALKRKGECTRFS
jgi:hypothetical protein